MTPQEYEAAYASAYMALRIKEVGKNWLRNKNEIERRNMEVYAKNKEGGKLGGRRKHEKRGKPNTPCETTLIVNKLLLEGYKNSQIAELTGIQVKSVGAIIRRNELPDEGLIS
jgi:hypothetical protein